MTLSVLDRLTSQTHRIKLPNDNSIFEVNPGFRAFLNEATQTAIEVREKSADGPPATSFAILCDEIHNELVRMRASDLPISGDPRNDCLNGPMSQLRFK